MRLWERVWYGIQDTGGFVIYSSTGQPILPAPLPAGQQYPTGQGKGKWVLVQTDAAGNNDLFWITALCQAILLNLNESPSFSNVGLPARQSVLTGVPPDYNMSLLQKRYAPYFQSLVITRAPGTGDGNDPQYLVNLVTHSGVVLSAKVPIAI
jgi:hypothetical protein